MAPPWTGMGRLAIRSRAGQAVSHLGRAGTEAASRLLLDAHTLSDSMTSAAALCETLTEVFDGWPGCGPSGG